MRSIDSYSICREIVIKSILNAYRHLLVNKVLYGTECDKRLPYLNAQVKLVYESHSLEYKVKIFAPIRIHVILG